MMCRSAELCRLDDPSWDGFVETHPLGWVCHLSAWQRILQGSFPHIDGHLLAIRDKSSIRAGLPVYHVRSWLSGNRLVSIPFATLCGPLVADSDDARLLVDAMLELSRAEGSRYVLIKAMRRLPPAAEDRFSRSDRFKHHALSVESDLETLRKRFDRSCVRQRIERALKSGLELTAVLDREGLRQFYGMYVKTRKRAGLPPQPFRFIRSLWETLSPSGRLQVHLARFRGAPVAGILLLRFNGRVSTEYLASDKPRPNLSPIQLLVWDAIRKAHDDGFRVFDFGRTDVSNVGLMDFKRRWGTDVSDLPSYCYPESLAETGELGNWSRSAAARRVIQMLPDRSNALLGGMLYRHMG